MDIPLQIKRHTKWHIQSDMGNEEWDARNFDKEYKTSIWNHTWNNGKYIL